MSARKTVLRGADMPVCGMRINATKTHGAAAIGRPDMPHTLRSPAGGFGAATARPFLGAQGLASATGTRALPPRDPGFPSFRVKRRKTRKATAINRISQITSIKAIQILRHKPSKRQKKTVLSTFVSLRCDSLRGLRPFTARQSAALRGRLAKAKKNPARPSRIF